MNYDYPLGIAVLEFGVVGNLPFMQNVKRRVVSDISKRNYVHHGVLPDSTNSVIADYRKSRHFHLGK